MATQKQLDEIIENLDPGPLEWDRLTAKEFEELIYCILVREGFLNVDWYGSSGNDRGRDIVCERNELWRPKTVRYKCVVQCKRYAGSVSLRVLREDLEKASAHKPHVFIIAVTGVLSASTKDW